MKLHLWFSADSYNCRFICVRIVINKQPEFSFHQMGSMTNKNAPNSLSSGADPRAPLGELTMLPQTS